MKVRELIEKTGWKLAAGAAGQDAEISGAYCGDLLSWVMGRGQPEQAWITVQSHINVIAVASLREFSCVILADGAKWPADVIAKAEEEQIPLLECEAPAFEIARTLVSLGI